MLVYLPAGALYSSVKLKVEKLDQSRPYSGIYKVGEPHIPMQRPMSLNIKCSFPDSLLATKAVIASVGKNGAMWSVGGVYDKQKEEICANISSFGTFTVAVDTIAPVVNTTLSNGAVVKSGNIVFRISDRLSGIKKYRVEIDGAWTLAEFDAKTRRLIVPLKYSRIKKGQKHNLKVTVIDRVGNQTVLNRNFTW